MKDKMTPAPWYIDADGYIRSKAEPKEWILKIPQEIDKDNAEAIVSAVNATYGNGIDPEVVPEFLRILQAYIDADDSHADVWIKMQRLKKQARAAIEKAKL